MRALAECTTTEVARLARNRKVVILLPLGAVEQHGPHLPLGVDWFGAEALARHIAPHLERAGHPCLLAPSLPYGASPLAADWSGTISLRGSTLRRVVGEIVTALVGHGFTRVVLVNYRPTPGISRPWPPSSATPSAAAVSACSSRGSRRSRAPRCSIHV